MSDIFKQTRAIAYALANTTVLWHAWLQTGKISMRAFSVVAYDRSVDAYMKNTETQKEEDENESTD